MRYEAAAYIWLTNILGTLRDNPKDQMGTELLVFGIEVDTTTFNARLPRDKLERAIKKTAEVLAHNSAAHKIPWNSITLHINRSNQEHDVESLLISTTTENTLHWKDAAMQICNIYGQGGWSATEIEVELYNHFRMAWNRSHVLGNNDKVINAFNKLRPAIESEVRYRCESAWSSIAFHNRTHVGVIPGPEKPTVIVICHQGSQCAFESLTVYWKPS